MRVMIGGFRADFGKAGTRSSPEDTDLCLRAAVWNGGNLDIRAIRGLESSRTSRSATLRYFVYRCPNEGWGKTALAVSNRMSESISTEPRYTRHVLPAALVRGLRETSRGKVPGGLAKPRHHRGIHYCDGRLPCRSRCAVCTGGRLSASTLSSSHRPTVRVCSMASRCGSDREHWQVQFAGMLGSSSLAKGPMTCPHFWSA
jgi:glucosyl-dolichyl phosphate glucuronosyltransferase